MTTEFPKTAMHPAGGYFYVGGEYVKTDSGTEHVGQMYVQYFRPAQPRFPYPIVMLHGMAQSGNNYLGTPDGRPGWASYFVDAGFTVYVVDQPGRARSNTPPALGSYTRIGAERLMQLLSASVFPQAALHSQWPGGKPCPGNPAFDQLMAGQVEFLEDPVQIERLNFVAHSALIKKIGPAVYLTHSQSGPFGWKLADAFPELIKAVVAVEPNGPPFYDVVFPGGEPWYEFKPGIARPQGVTREPLHFDPPLGPEGFSPVRAAASDNADLVQGWLQAEPARRLTRLADVPVMILTGQASYRATYDHCTSAFLTQAGVANTHIRLEDKGVFGNSHMMMLELNNADSAKVIIEWLKETITCPSSAPS